MSISIAVLMKAVEAAGVLQQMWEEHRLDRADLERLREELETLDHDGQANLLLERSKAIQARADSLRDR